MKTPIPAAALVVLLSGCAATLGGGGAQTQPTPPAAVGTGCLDAEVHACLNAIKSYVNIRSIPGMSIDEQLASQSRLDVNGKPIGGGNLIDVLGRLKNAPMFASNGVSLHYNEHRIVDRVTVSLGQNPIITHTAAEYATTGIWEAALIAGGSRCAAVGSLAMYQLFENEVKPTITYGKKEYNITDTKAETTSLSYSKDVSVCGDLKMGYHTSHGIDTSDISSSNPQGSYSFASVTFTH